MLAALWRVTPVRTLAVLLPGLSACAFDVDYNGTRYRCDQGQACPAGQVCIAGACLASGGDAGPGGRDAGPGGRDAGPGSDVGCGKVGLLADDFDDGVTDQRWGWSFQNGGAIYAEVGGRLIIAPAADKPGSSHAGYASTRTYDLTDARLSVEVPEMVNVATSAEAYLAALSPQGGALVVVQSRGVLSFVTRAGNDERALASVPYDPGEHRFWQIREAQGTIYFETSSDGVNFTERAQTTAPFSPAWIRVELGAGTFERVLDPGAVAFDRLVGGGTPVGRYCPPTALFDDFSANSELPAWARSYSDAGAMRQRVGGEAVLRPPLAAPGWTGFVSSTAYDLRESSATIRVVDVGDPSQPVTAFLRLERDQENAIDITHYKGVLAFGQWVDGVYDELARTQYDPAVHRYWRLRESGGTTFWETSSDGLTFTVWHQAPNPIDPSVLDVAIGAGQEVSVLLPRAVRFDDYNVPPAP